MRCTQRDQRSLRPHTVAQPAPGRLIRPTLGPAIPTVLQRQPLANIAQLALLLLDAGIFSHEDWRCSRKHLAAHCERALTRWINERTSQLRCIRPYFRLIAGSNKSSSSTFERSVPSSAFLEILWFVDGADIFVVGPQVERLEGVRKGLGLAALSALSKYSWSSFPMMLCQHQLDLAEATLWGGEANVEDYIESYGMDDEDAEATRAESLSRDDILAQTPEWLLKNHLQKTPTPGSLRTIERRSVDMLAREVAELIRLLDETSPLINHHEAFQEEGGEFYGFSAFVRWSEHDYTLGVAERLIEYSISDGVGYEACGIHQQSLGDLNSFVQWTQEMDNIFAVTRLLDRLLWLLSGANSPYALNEKEGSDL